MKNKWMLLIFLQIIVSLISGILMSKMSWIGKVGVSTVHTEYAFLKNWFAGFAVVLFFQLALIGILWLIKRTTTFKSFSIVNLVMIIIGLLGLLYTFYDFNNTSHQYMNSMFHMGGYLFWAGWFITCLFFFFARVKPKPIETPLTNDVHNIPNNNLENQNNQL